MIEWLRDRYLTWRTGKDKSTRDWETWYHQNVIWTAGDITNMFQNFKHVIEVNSDVFFDPNEKRQWVPCPDAKQYFWPHRTPDKTCVWRFERVFWDKWSSRWMLNEIAGEDRVFVATNSDRDAMMITLKYLA